MDSLIIPAVLGIVIIFLGITNMKGNISTLHRYHRYRVSEEDRLPFGRLVGAGTIIVGVSLLLRTGFQFAEDYMNLPVMNTIGNVVLGAGLAAGFGVMFYAMFKYNKGIF
ncbi:MAG: hypothetical protein IKG46_13500 [Solobacterium sp.]|nr:hypothetical protein [Solobacterium sp.]